MEIREKVVLLAVLLMVFTYMVLVKWVPPQNHDPGIPSKFISEPLTDKPPVKEDVFFPPLPKNTEKESIVEETVTE